MTKALPIQLAYSVRRFAFVAKKKLEAGTYYFRLYSTSSTSTYDVYSFSINEGEEIPIGGGLTTYSINDFTRLVSWDDSRCTNISNNITCVKIDSADATGINLGRIRYNQRYTTNAYVYANDYLEIGNGRFQWDLSNIRQWLNSADTTGKWWTPADTYDYLGGIENNAAKVQTYYHGFLSEWSSDFVNAMLPVKTGSLYYYNASRRVSITYDKVILPSVTNLYVNPWSSYESDYDEAHEYWKTLNGTDTPWSRSSVKPEFVTEALDGGTCVCWTRSLSNSNGNAGNVIMTTGAMESHYARALYNFTPMVCIGKVVTNADSQETGTVDQSGEGT